jgi:hypothetical protein
MQPSSKVAHYPEAVVNKPTRVIVAVLWILSLVAVSRWTAHAQTSAPPGYEVRFVKGQGNGNSSAGVLLANFGGQWLPVAVGQPQGADSLPMR